MGCRLMKMKSRISFGLVMGCRSNNNACDTKAVCSKKCRMLELKCCEVLVTMPVEYMERALSLAELALGHASPNPAVGAVIIRDGEIVGEGYTQPPGSDHAEIVALHQAGENARGATMYVTLEPCCHFGRTPPCTQSIIAAGIKEVHMAIIDPNPVVNGKGKDELEKAGIKTYLGEEEEKARLLNECYIKYITTGTPFITVKFAMSLDGKIATRTGDSKWISGEAARRYAHFMRYAADAIMVGINTILVDNPHLTQRVGKHGGQAEKQPLRVIVDSKGRIPLNARVFKMPGKTLVAVANMADRGKKDKLTQMGVQVMELPGDDERVDLHRLLQELGKKEISNILVEGGSTLLGSFFDQKLADKIIIFLSPVIIGGEDALSPIGGKGVSKMSEAIRLNRVKMKVLSDDALIMGYVK